MSTPTPHIHNWLGAPKGSRLLISVTNSLPTEIVVATVEFIVGVAPAKPVIFEDPEVHPGPLELQLPTVTAYDANVVLNFSTDATATVTAFVEKPDGTRFPEDYQKAFKGERNDVTLIAFTVITINPDFLL